MRVNTEYKEMTNRKEMNILKSRTSRTVLILARLMIVKDDPQQLKREKEKG